jgi:hypothetical protein
LQISGSAWTLPSTNVPQGKHVGCAKLSDNIRENFGLFTPDPDAIKDAQTLELLEVKGKGVDNEDVGMGVFTKVQKFVFFFFCFFFAISLLLCQVARKQGEYLLSSLLAL